LGIDEAAMPRETGGPISVAIIEDDRRIRDGLRTLINGREGYRCQVVFRSMEEALARTWNEVPDVALVDIGLPGMSGIDGLSRLQKRYPTIALMMLTVYEDDERIFEALCAGASGYLLKKTAPNKLLECLVEVMRGGVPMSPEVARRVLRLFREIRPPERVEHDLTPHELRLPKTAGGGSQLAKRRSRVRREFQHYQFSHAEYLWKAACALQIGSRSQSATPAAGQVATPCQAPPRPAGGIPSSSRPRYRRRSRRSSSNPAADY
jgi:DNA-binding NarL/FixJ family response regulator